MPFHSLLILISSLNVAKSYRLFPEKRIVHSINTVFGGNHFTNNYEANAKMIPYHALIFYSNLYCSGSLIGSKTVLTSASCFHQRAVEKTYVKLGANATMEATKTYEVANIKIHEYYKRLTEIDNDIAMLFLKKHVTFGDTVKKTILVEPEVSLREGLSMHVSGFGSENLPKKYQGKLLSAMFVVATEAECRSVYGNMVTDSAYCAKYTEVQRLSDNGGGAVYGNILIGILAAGGLTEFEPRMAIFTNISYFHRWISKNMWNFLREHCVTPVEYDSSDTDDD